MSAIQRQINPDLKQAVELAARGRVIESMNLLQKSIVELKQPEERYTQIAKDYASLPQKEREKTLVVSGTNEARKAINKKVRENLSFAGKGHEIITLESKDLTKAQKKETKNYQLGDLVCPQRDYSSLHLNKGELYTVKERQKNYITLQKPDGSLVKWKPNEKNKVNVYQSQKQEIALGEIVRITQNDRKKDLINGDRAKIIKIDEKKNIYCQKQSGKVFKLDGSQPLHLEYGYCSTVHSAQGKTCEKILIEADTKSLTSARDNYYVAISRARQEATIYTNDKSKLPVAMSRRNEKEAALELNR
jgi:ATP-dependent exoDNAse (exonuclease V) alpha subunit